MSHALDSHWILPGSSSSYRIVWWHDAAAKDSSRHAPLFEVLSHLRKWIRSYELTLRRIDEALGEQPRENLSRLEGRRGREQIEKRISQAFREGRLVAVPATTGSAVSVSVKNPFAAAERKDMTVLVVDENGETVPGARYRIETVDGVREGVLNPQGEARESNVRVDEYKITFLDD